MKRNFPYYNDQSPVFNGALMIESINEPQVPFADRAGAMRNDREKTRCYRVRKEDIVYITIPPRFLFSPNWEVLKIKYYLTGLFCLASSVYGLWLNIKLPPKEDIMHSGKKPILK